MAYDWTRLAPHRPLKPRDPLHVRRPGDGGDEIARWIAAGADAVAIAGPVGSGKSTELAWAASSLWGRFVAVQVPLDKVLDMRRITEDQVFLQVAGRIAAVAHGALKLPLSAALEERLTRVRSAPPMLAPGVLTSPARDLLLQTLREVAESSHQGEIALLVDGLEKCAPSDALQIARALLELKGQARIVLIAPFTLVVGSGAHELLSSVDRLFFLHAVPVRQDMGARGEAGRAFLREIVRLRLDLSALPDDLVPLLDQAAVASGGVPRSFLQLVRAAGTYAALGVRETMMAEDLAEAMNDHIESLERLLVEGDIEELRRADGTTGVEIPEERRLRLLSHGLLLEYKTEAGDVVHPAPLLERALRKGVAP